MNAIATRPMGHGDVGTAVDLINRDRVDGQAACTADDIVGAMQGKSSVDSGWWDRLSMVRTEVAERNGVVIGVVSYAMRADEATGYVLWLHCHEQRDVAQVLIGQAVSELGPVPLLRAFWFATPLARGLEGLPISRRSVTHAALTGAGFSGEDLWLYMLARPIGTDDTVAEVAASEHSVPGVDERWDFTIRRGQTEVATACASSGQDRKGMIWWIEVKPQFRGNGYGRRLFGQVLRFLDDRGATEVALVVDHDDPQKRDRRPAIRMYESFGFRTVEHLWSYTRVTEVP